MGVTGGIAVQHRYRLRGGIPDRIREIGYLGGLWRAVHDDVLDLPSWVDYVKPGVHGHAIVFPGYLEPHRKIRPIVAKYDTLDSLANVVAHVRYLLDHTAFQEGESDRSYTSFGDMYGWNMDGDASPDMLLAVRDDVASRVGMVWDDIHKRLIYPPPEIELGVAPAPEFKGIGRLHQDMIDAAWCADLSDGQYEFMQRIFLSMKGYNTDMGGGLTSWLPYDDWEPLVPDDMQVWGDVVKPPPWVVASSYPDDPQEILSAVEGAYAPETILIVPEATLIVRPFYENMKVHRRQQV